MNARRLLEPAGEPANDVVEEIVDEVVEDETAEQFFSSHPPAPLEVSDEPLEDERAIDVRRSRVPPARRARHLRIVKASVLLCAFLCVAAGFRVVVTGARSAVGSAPPLAALTMTTARAESSPAVATVAAPPPPVAAPAQEVAAAAAPTSSVDARWPDSRAATRAAVAALESHHVEDAIAAAQAATVLDPGNGEAWLLLGAAYQDRGKLPEAIDAYRNCKTQGRSDPRGECRAMLSSLGAR
jgi:hypothetical protein